MSDQQTTEHKSGISRRGFVTATASMAAALAVTGGLSACQPKEEKKDPTDIDVQDEVRDIVTGEWISAACWHNCGGRCVNKALVRDGVVIRQKTDDCHEDTPDYPQQRSCLRGRSQRMQCFGVDRIKYPMKRKNWSPDDPKGYLRGKDEWERISWDEAIEILASELNKAKAKYGNRSIIMETYGDAESMFKVLNQWGGVTTRWGTMSMGSWAESPLHHGFMRGSSWEPWTVNDRLDLKKSEYIVCFGQNPIWSASGNPTYNTRQAILAGAKMIAIDPFYNDSYAVWDAEWVPCYPGSDTAFWIGVAYQLFVLDEQKGGYIDWEFLNSHAIGHDAEHMPAGEDPAGNFKDYALGTYDGVPKNAAWTYKRTGVTEENLMKVVEAIKPEHRTAILCSWGPGRCNNADNLPQIVMTIGAMTGHYGKPGHACGVSPHNKSHNSGDVLCKNGSTGLPTVDPLKAMDPSQVNVGQKYPVEDCINSTEIWKAILTGKYNYTGCFPNGNNAGGKSEIRDIDIHVILHANRCLLQTLGGQMEGIEAHRKVDFVMTQAHFLNTNAKYSDLILPINTYWERDGNILVGNREAIFVVDHVVDSLYESHSDQWIAHKLADALGVDWEELVPYTERQQFFNQIKGSWYLDEDGKTKKNIATITQEDIDRWGVTGKPQEGVIAIDDLVKQGYYQVPRKEGDNYGSLAYEAFVKDPENNPLSNSPSGKFEIFSRELADTINGMGYSTIDPIPTYIPPLEGYEDTFFDFEKGIKGEYPYQLFNIHYPRRVHTVLDNNPWLCEAWTNPLFISETDAAAEGIEDDDTVMVVTKYGKSLRHARITNRLMPGCIFLPHGSWSDIDPVTGIDYAGSDNVLSGQVGVGAGVSGWNTQICRIEKWTGDPLIQDVDKPLRTICD